MMSFPKGDAVREVGALSVAKQSPLDRESLINQEIASGRVPRNDILRI